MDEQFKQKMKCKYLRSIIYNLIKVNNMKQFKGMSSRFCRNLPTGLANMESIPDKATRRQASQILNKYSNSALCHRQGGCFKQIKDRQKNGDH